MKLTIISPKVPYNSIEHQCLELKKPPKTTKNNAI